MLKWDLSRIIYSFYLRENNVEEEIKAPQEYSEFCQIYDELLRLTTFTKSSISGVSQVSEYTSIYITIKGCKTYSVSTHKIPLSCRYHFSILKGWFEYIWHLWELSTCVSQYHNRLCCQVTERKWFYECQQKRWCRWSNKTSISRYYMWREYK